MVDIPVLILLIQGVVGSLSQVNKFPANFLLGTSTASYQIEGAWNEDGKGENIWDNLTHSHPEYIVDGQNGDIAADSYHLYTEDVSLLKDLGANVYRFSLSWSRILPTGYIDKINQPGIDYYNNLIDKLLANGIQPMVTIYHWDLPQPLQDIGGWPNPLLADFYADFARLVFSKFGDKVKWWITFNEPKEVSMGYAKWLDKAPSINAHGIGEYLTAHTILKAHAKAYHIYDQEFRPTQNGKVSITLNQEYCQPKDEASQADIDAAERCMQFYLGWYAHPIYSNAGDYPNVLKKRIYTNSIEKEGRARSRLPEFTEEEIKYIRGTYDYFALNHYSTNLITEGESGGNPSIDRDSGTISSKDGSWPTSASDWLRVTPWGIRRVINWVSKEYNSPEIFVTENGYSDYGALNDSMRQYYHYSYLAEVLKAINLDGNKVIGYTAWTLIDNFEWMRGYTERFGLYYIDYSSSGRTRIAKDSVAIFRQILTSREIPIEYVNGSVTPPPAPIQEHHFKGVK